MLRSLRRSVRSLAAVAFLAGLVHLFRLLSWRRAQRLGAGLGRIAWRLSRRDRRRSLDHLALAFAELGPRERMELGRASFEHHGITLGECLFLASRDCKAVLPLVEVEGWDVAQRARAEGRPLVILTGHCGNWELLAALINCLGLPLTVLARRPGEPLLDRLLLSMRRRYGTETIARGTPRAPRELLRALRGGSALGMLIDQDTRVEGVWVPFFGRPAYTPVAAAQIALRREALVVPAFIHRLADGRHRARFQSPMDLAPEVEEATAQMTRLIEEQVRRFPVQWVWMHRRWRRQPPEGGG